jgi:hypothetical protein
MRRRSQSAVPLSRRAPDMDCRRGKILQSVGLFEMPLSKRSDRGEAFPVYYTDWEVDGGGKW